MIVSAGTVLALFEAVTVAVHHRLQDASRNGRNALGASIVIWKEGFRSSYRERLRS